MYQMFLAVPLSFLLGTTALAQTSNLAPIDADDDESAALETMIVTGTKQDFTVQETDVSVEIFSPERLEQESIFNLDDLILRAPNVNSTGGGASLSIRGISREGVGGAGQGVTSNIYLDGAPISTNALAFGFDSLWDVAQVEILRGPQSTVQGRNALAGAIVITTNDPTYEWEAAGRARYESFDTLQFSGAVSGPIIDDQLAFRFTVDYQSTDGFVESVFVDGSNTDFQENLLLRGKLLFEPEFLPGLRAEIIFDYNDSNAGALFSFVTGPGPANVPSFFDFDPLDQVGFNLPNENEAETFRIIGDIAYEINEYVTLRGIATYEDNTSDAFFGAPDNPALFPDATNSITDNSSTTTSGEIRAEFDIGRWSGIAGAYYFEDSEDLNLAFFLPLQGQSPFPITPVDTILGGTLLTLNDTQNYAFYGQVRFELNEKWTFDFGFRYDREEFDTNGGAVGDPTTDPESCTVDVPGVVIGIPLPVVTLPCTDLIGIVAPPVDLPAQSAAFDVFLPRGAITYNITDDHSVFASAQRGYRAGGSFVQQTAAGFTVGTFDPEFLTNIEVGFRTQWLDKRLTINGNLFYSWLEDQQVVIPGPTGAALDSATINAGESTIIGLELSANFVATESLDFYASLGLLDAEFDDFPFAISPENPFFNLAGNQFPLSAPVSFTVGGTYDHESGFFADASLNFTGTSNSGVEQLDAETFEEVLGDAFIPGQTEDSGARAVLNLRIGYTYKNFTISGYATNLLDDESFTAQNLAFPDVAAGAGPESLTFFPTPSFTLQDPRTFGVSLDVRF